MKYRKSISAVLTLALVLMVALTGCSLFGNTDDTQRLSGTGAGDRLPERRERL